MDQNNGIVIHLTSEPRYFSIVRAAAEAAAFACDLGSAAASQIKIAVTEALANVTNHGYKGQTDRPIRITLAPARDHGRTGLSIMIEDECTDVDLARIQGRPLDEVRPGGLGVHIIHKTMDQVEYRRRSNGEGICLHMVKYAKVS